MAQKIDKFKVFQFCGQIKDMEVNSTLIITPELKEILVEIADTWSIIQLARSSKTEKKRQSSIANGKLGGRKPIENPTPEQLRRRKSGKKRD
jgi:hypothetical protein